MAGTSPTPRKAPAKKTTAPRRRAAASQAPAPEWAVSDDAKVILDLDALPKSEYLPNVPTEPFVFQHDSQKWLLEDARDFDYRELLGYLGNPVAFIARAMPEGMRAEFDQHTLAGWKLDAIFKNWQTYYKVEGLGDLMPFRSETS